MKKTFLIFAVCVAMFSSGCSYEQGKYYALSEQYTSTKELNEKPKKDNEYVGRSYSVSIFNITLSGYKTLDEAIDAAKKEAGVDVLKNVQISMHWIWIPYFFEYTTWKVQNQ